METTGQIRGEREGNRGGEVDMAEEDERQRRGDRGSEGAWPLDWINGDVKSDGGMGRHQILNCSHNWQASAVCLEADR